MNLLIVPRLFRPENYDIKQYPISTQQPHQIVTESTNISRSMSIRQPTTHIRGGRRCSPGTHAPKAAPGYSHIGGERRWQDRVSQPFVEATRIFVKGQFWSPIAYLMRNLLSN